MLTLQVTIYLTNSRTTVSISNKDELFCSKLDDAMYLCSVRQKPYYTTFMGETKQTLAKKYFQSVKFDSYLFFGGYELSERKILGLFPYEISKDDFPISALEFKFRACDKLSHRNFLGALMSLGIERDTVGDILVEDGRAVVFVKSEIKEYITSQLFKIGNVGIKIKDAQINSLPQGREQVSKSLTVSSLRLDNVVSASCNLSREKTRTTILSGDVCLNYEQTQNVSKVMSKDDEFSVRGYGKFILNDVFGQTKKGRIKISVLYFR